MSLLQAGTKIPFAFLVLATAVPALTAACEDEDVLPPTGLEEADLVGVYEATTLVVTVDETDASDGEPSDAEPSEIDVLEAGGSLTVELRADGTATGTASFLGFDAIDEEETLHGTWEFDDLRDRVTLDIPRISRLDGVALDVEQGSPVRLVADGSVEENRFDITGFDVVLTQQDAMP